MPSSTVTSHALDQPNYVRYIPTYFKGAFKIYGGQNFEFLKQKKVTFFPYKTNQIGIGYEKIISPGFLKDVCTYAMCI